MLRAFIKQYAEAVGLDPEELFEEFNNEIPIHMQMIFLGSFLEYKQNNRSSEGSSKFLDVLPKVTHCDCCDWFICFYLVVFVKEIQEMMTNPISQDENKQETTYEESEELIKENEEKNEETRRRNGH